MNRSTLEIDKKQLIKNYLIYKSLLDEKQDIYAVIKANAYGHGAVEVARILEKAGCKYFAVACINEAIRLRENGIKGEILILGYTSETDSNDLIKYDIVQTIADENHAEMLKNKGIRAHLAIDTGMHRIGIDGNDRGYCENFIRKYHDSFKLEGLFTHLCVAESDKEFSQLQLQRFKNITESVKDLNIKHIHYQNSCGGLEYEAYGDLVRLGIILYGLKPDYTYKLPEGIKPIVCWKTIVSMIKVVKKGESLGYGLNYTCDKDTMVATIPIGYGDGYLRRLGKEGYVLINNQKAKIIGNICMDQLMLDVTDIKDIERENEVILMNDCLTADELAKMSDTIAYEIVCGISDRVERKYI